MRLTTRPRDRERRFGVYTRRVQAGDEIARHERAIARHADHPFDGRRLTRHPVEPGQDAGERPGKARNVIRHDRTAIGREPGGVAIGIDEDAGAGGREASKHPIQNGFFADPDQRLVAAAHPACEASRQNEAVGARGVVHRLQAWFGFRSSRRL